ncbi:MAG: hypothetical protein QG567_1582 [Campylobacterota bacterium]|nr:hypothetical protein [Campylobacterota bacterium]
MHSMKAIDFCNLLGKSKTMQKNINNNKLYIIYVFLFDCSKK